MPDTKVTIEAPEAVQRAAGYLKNLIPTAEKILLEELEKVSDEESSYWMITLSFYLDLAKTSPSPFVISGMGLGDREYKTFKIDAFTGEVISMKIMKL